MDGGGGVLWGRWPTWLLRMLDEIVWLVLQNRDWFVLRLFQVWRVKTVDKVRLTY